MNSKISVIWKYVAIVSTALMVLFMYSIHSLRTVLDNHDESTIYRKLYPEVNIYEMKWHAEHTDLKTYRQMIELHKADAREGSAIDNWLLGWHYAYGLGVNRDRQLAKAYFINSGAPNLQASFYDIYLDYSVGKSIVEKDPEEAEFWRLATEEQRAARQ